MDISLLKRLTLAPGISGQEGAVRDIVEEILGELTAEISTDAMGRLIARVPGEGPRVLIDAHMDKVYSRPCKFFKQVRPGGCYCFSGKTAQRSKTF
jgi:hypothetical protein